MPESDPINFAPTHTVENQPPPFEDVDLFTSDAVLREGLSREGGDWAKADVRRFGQTMGSREANEDGRLANAYPPELRTHDRYGNRINEVEFHPAWHATLTRYMEAGVHNFAWKHPKPGAHVAKTALHFIAAQTEAGAGCPITMTFACVPALRHQPDVYERLEPLLLECSYDDTIRPMPEKKSILVGMAMTEKQGGSDVRTNTTRATAIDPSDDAAGYALVGHKWFCSAPLCDAFLTLAHTERGITCFLVPRWRPDGSRNAMELQRLKNKLGNRSNASSEIEYRGTWAERIGEEGRGIATIIEMVHHTRLDCVSGSAGLMRRALAEAIHQTEHRSAFGKRLREQSLMQNVLADLALEVEAATTLMLRLSRAYDDGAESTEARAFARMATAVGKYWVCKRAPHMIYEAMECLGGSGYVEESVLPRLYREAPVNAIWEGSGNVICLDVLRAMVREPESLEAFMTDVKRAKGETPRLDTLVAEIDALLAATPDLERNARTLAEKMAVAIQASLLIRYAPNEVADAFVASRIADDGGRVFGTLSSDAAFDHIIDRASPNID